jgi:nicotinamide mononucleotide transporter PnuC
MKKLFKDWNWFELTLLFVGLVVVICCFFVEQEKNYLSFASSIVGIVMVVCMAKGLVFAPIIAFVSNVLYAILSITEGYYGEAIIYFALMTPITIFSIVSWLRNRNAKNSAIVKVNKVSKKEYLYLGLFTIVGTIGFYFLLKVLNTNELVVSTMSLVSSVVASYLMVRRSSYYSLAFVVNDVILIILWSIAASKNIAYLPTVICFCVYAINDTYGFFNWKHMEKLQASN